MERFMILHLIIRKKNRRRWVRPENYTRIRSFSPKELGAEI